MKKGKELLTVSLILALLWGGIWFVYWPNCTVQTEEVPIYSTALPAAFDGLRVAEIADLHGRELGENSRTLLRAVRLAEPDLICIDGDLFEETPPLSMLRPLLQGLTEIAPTFYVKGNHEWQVEDLRLILSQMEAMGVHVLQNEYLVLQRGEARLVVAGVDDPCGPYDQKTPEQLVSEIRAAEGAEAYILMLAHRNDTLAQWSALGVQTVLTGHCHGGVVRLPFVGGVFGTRRELFPDYDAGLYHTGDTSLYVSRGLGYSNVRIRLFNRPHLPILILRQGDFAEKT